MVGYDCNPSLKAFIGQNPNSQVASMESRGFKIKMETVAEIYVKDPSRTILIEYVPNIY